MNNVTTLRSSGNPPKTVLRRLASAGLLNHPNSFTGVVDLLDRLLPGVRWSLSSDGSGRYYAEVREAGRRDQAIGATPTTALVAALSAFLRDEGVQDG